MKKNKVIEELAKIEHDQWVSWAQAILKDEKISKERSNRWKKLFVPYDELRDDDKDDDRKWAKKVYSMLQNLSKNNK